MIYYEFDEPITYKDWPSIEGFRIPDGGIGAGPGGLFSDRAEVLIHFGWFLRTGTEVYDIKVADAEQIQLDGDAYAALVLGKPDDAIGSRFEDLILEAYKAIATIRGWSGTLWGVTERVTSLSEAHPEVIV